MRAKIVAMVVCAVVVVGSAARAEVTVTATQTGGDVVFEASGTLNLDDWTLVNNETAVPKINSSASVVLVGEVNFGSEVDVYGLPPETYVGPDNFGTGREATPGSGSGDLFGFRTDLIVVPDGYVSGEALLSSMTFHGVRLFELGMDVGTYVWSWGVGPTADSFTLVVVDPTPTEEESWGSIKSHYK